MDDYINKEAMRTVLRDQEHRHGLKGLAWVEMAMDKLPTVPEPQWISVEDNPPGDEYDYVLAYKPYLAKIGGNGFVIEHPWFVRRNKTYKYWMPLPEPPKEGHHEY